jgi:hypothetical protein
VELRILLVQLSEVLRIPLPVERYILLVLGQEVRHSLLVLVPVVLHSLLVLLHMLPAAHHRRMVLDRKLLAELHIPPVVLHSLVVAAAALVVAIHSPDHALVLSNPPPFLQSS